jgi:hypothetical protein
MDMMVYIVIGIVCVVVWSLIGWEMYNAPLYPDDYPNEPGSPNPKACGCNECQCQTNLDR